jgi:hypothetical protein
MGQTWENRKSLEIEAQEVWKLKPRKSVEVEALEKFGA